MTRARSWLWPMLAAGFIIRLLFMGQSGFANDVSSFEAWALGLAAHPTWQFYASTSFADYPPGYFYVLWIVGHVFAAIGHGNYDVLKYLVKVPAVLCDLADGALIFTVVRRFTSDRAGLAAAALFVFNPAVIFISASWGQVDSISCGLALLAVYWLLRSEDSQGRQAIAFTIGAWVVFAYSLLIKPQAAILIPLFIAFAFVHKDAVRERVRTLALGIAGAIAVVFLLTLPFHPSLDAFAWLFQKYQFGSSVYPYNTVNAFNLWSINNTFWVKDATAFIFMPMSAWGLLLLAAATAVIVARYIGSGTPQMFLQAAALLSLAFFLFATRMHERYVYDGLLFTIVAAPLGRRYAVAAVIYSFTLFVNLFYSLAYLDVVTHSTAGVNALDLWPAVTHPLSILNVATFFVLAYVYLGQEEAAIVPAAQAAKPAPEAQAEMLKARNWYDPREGLARMVWPLDYALCAALSVVSFIVSYVNYWLPTEKVFDEIYFARAAEEYLKGLYIYENTHPPLTKLIITLSVMLFGGLHGGDNSHGWRFLDVVFGAIAIAVIYAFAKRLTRSSAFAAVAAIFFIADGMHFVQSRIATPEGIVVVFALGALYAFYRYWIASQSIVRAEEPRPARRVAAAVSGALVLGFATSVAINSFMGPSTASEIVFGLFFSSGWYLLLRLLVVPRWVFVPAGRFISYADGSSAVQDRSAIRLRTPDGKAIGKDLQDRDGELLVTYRRAGTVSYATPAGSATYAPGSVETSAGETQQGRHATAWLIAFTVLLGALVASKWYGVMAYPVSFVTIAFVWSQRYWLEGRKLWGNPFGFRLDVSVAAIVFLSMSVYLCAWIPDLVRHVPNDQGALNSFKDLVYRQYSMYEYHDTLKATHPYQSSWWQWPLDERPIAYYWHDTRGSALSQIASACCVSEIISLPNPLILWLGLLTVPLIGFLAWRERNKGYGLLVLAYVLQWVPWARSPRITFAYHFYVDVPIVILCNVIVLQRVWRWYEEHPGEGALLARIAVGAYVVAVVAAFVWFYPILAGTPLPWNLWHARMWLGNSWV